MFEIRNLKHAYDGAEVLSVPAWQAEQGTLLHILAGILRPSSGSASVAGQELPALRPAALDRFRGRNIGLVLQRLHLIPSLTVLDNLLLAQYLAGLPQDRARAEEALAALDLRDKGEAHPHELSFGQAQRVAVARAMVNRPKLLLADEPTSNLDDARCLQALELLQAQARACSATLVIATHDQRIRARIPNQFELKGTA